MSDAAGVVRSRSAFDPRVRVRSVPSQKGSAWALPSGDHEPDGRKDPAPSTAHSAPQLRHDFSTIPVHPPAIAAMQPQLLGDPRNDAYEQEADRVADAMVLVSDQGTPRGPRDELDSVRVSPGLGELGKDVSRKSIEDEEDVPPKSLAVAEKAIARQSDGLGDRGLRLEPEIGARIEAMRNGGQPLPSSERDFMESRFGADFGSIRVHADDEADSCSRAIGARAFTLGGDIFFRAGEYEPARSEGRRLLAHELTHTIQQGAAGAGMPGGLRTGVRGSATLSVQRDLFIPPPSPAATARVLTEAEIASAIDFNSKQFKDPASLEEFRDVIGISPTPAVSDRELALTVAQWQAEFRLTVDGKAGDLTVGTIVRELKAEGLTPAGLSMLLDVHRTAPPGRAALNFLPILHDQAPAGWGVTVNDDPIFDISVFAAPGVWKCVITKADQRSHQGTRLVAGAVEVTAGLVVAEANCPRLTTMSTSLNTVANQGAHSGFYMIAAVQAHEDVHITQYRAALAPHYTTLRTAIEALTVPLGSHNTAAAAKAAIKALPAFTVAMATFHAADVAVNNATGAHAPVAPFSTAEHGVVAGMIAVIAARRTALGCPP